mgnify:FL=1
MPNVAWQQQQQMAMQQQMAAAANMQQQQQQAMQMQAMRMQAMQQQQMRAQPQQQQALQQPQQQQQHQPLPSPAKQYSFPGARKRPAPADFTPNSSSKPVSNKAAKRAAASAPLVPLSGPVVVRPAANAEEAAEIEAWKAERRRHWPSAANTAKKVRVEAAARGATVHRRNGP